MAGRRQKAADGGWNGGFAPYGYELVDGKLLVVEDEAEVIKLIFEKFSDTTMGANGVAAWLNNHGYTKKVRQNGKLDTFSAHFVKLVLDNPVYMGKIAYGRRRNEKIQGKRNEYHIVKQEQYPIYAGKHEAIISEELWERAHAKRIDTGIRPDKKEKEHEYILSGLLKCPGCGAPMYGVPSRSKKHKDGTPYPPYYSYLCRTKISETGRQCPWHKQVSAKRIDTAVKDIITSLVQTPEFESEIKTLIGEQVDLSGLQAEMASYRKRMHQAYGTQHKLEQQLDALDVTDELYDRKYESLNRRLDEKFIEVGNLEGKIAELESRIKSVEQEKLSRDSVYEYLLIFDRIYEKMTDKEKKTFMQSFVREIEIYPEKQPNGQQVKTISFRFPVSYGGRLVEEISLPYENHVETICLLSRTRQTAP
jgi:site-specific DNA recombinase